MRILDVFASAGGLIALSPVFAVIAILIELDSPGPVFYRAQRVGKNGTLFRLYKFRTMAVGADKRGPGLTGANDPRVTMVGRFLRRTKLDELPQLLNVLKGEMSLVGPRPEDPRYVALYTPEQRRVLAQTPGITSPASLCYRDEQMLLTGVDFESLYVTRILPAKLKIELDYMDRRSLWSDLRLVWQTVATLARSQQQPRGDAPQPER